MEQIKVGDWAISTSYINNEPRKITKIELAITSIVVLRELTDEYALNISISNYFRARIR